MRTGFCRRALVGWLAAERSEAPGPYVSGAPLRSAPATPPRRHAWVSFLDPPYRWLLGLIVLVPLAGCRQSTDLEQFYAAQEAFDTAASEDDFLQVAAQYQEILDRGGPCGAVYYNRGNALMLADQRGRAIAAYRQARRYRPADSELDANLRNALGTDGSAAPGRPLIEHVLFWQNWFSYPAKFYLAAAAAAATFVLGVLALLVLRRLFRRLAVAGVVLTALLVLSAAYDWYRFDHLVHGVVVVEEATARKGDGPNYKPAFTEPLTEGTEFELLARRGDWLQIRLSGNQEGWIEQTAAVVY